MQSSSPELIAQNSSTKSGAGVATILKLSIDGEHFYLPQSDLVSFENLDHLETTDCQDNSVASLPYNGIRLPVYCLSSKLQLLDYIGTKRRVCIVCQHQQGYFGLLIDHIEKLAYQKLRIETLPAPMRVQASSNADTRSQAASAVSSLLLYKDKQQVTHIGLLLRDVSLQAYLQPSITAKEIA